MSSRSFLWINKDPSSNSLSNNRTGPLPYSQINKHVQRQTARRNLKKKTVESSAKGLVGWQTQLPSPPNSAETGEPLSGEASGDDAEDAVTVSSSPSPYQPIDSYANALIRLTASEHNALQYFLKVWMPADDHVPPNCQIAGFTPIWPNDGKASTMVMQGALQTDDPVSIYALLTAATRRAQTLNHVQPDKTNLPEEFSLKAVQALRRRIELRLPPSERLILDLSYLILAELYARSPSRSVIFWKMTRDQIVSFGGLHKLEPFTALAALAYDYFIAMGTVSFPALDTFRDPALLDVDPSLDMVQLYDAIRSRQDELEARVRLVTYQNHEFSQVVNALRLLPQSAMLEVRALVQGNVRKLYPLIAAPFQRTSGERTDSGNTKNVMAADSLSLHVRHLTYRIWLWHTACTFAKTFAVDKSARIEMQPPANVVEELWMVSTWLDQIQTMLEGSGWTLNLGVTFWMCAICYLVAERDQDRRSLTAQLRTRASELRISSRGTLSQVLIGHMPLPSTRSNALDLLWNAISVESGEISTEAD